MQQYVTTSGTLEYSINTKLLSSFEMYRSEISVKIFFKQRHIHVPQSNFIKIPFFSDMYYYHKEIFENQSNKRYSQYILENTRRFGCTHHTVAYIIFMSFTFIVFFPLFFRCLIFHIHFDISESFMRRSFIIMIEISLKYTRTQNLKYIFDYRNFHRRRCYRRNESHI